MSDINIHMNISSFMKGVDLKKIEVKASMVKAMQSLCINVRDEAINNLDKNNSVITGKLKNSINFEINEGVEIVTGLVGPNAKAENGVQYGKYVEFGRPSITAKNGGYLTFQTPDGQWHKVHTVAAAPAKPFLGPALLNTETKAPELIREIMNL